MATLKKMNPSPLLAAGYPASGTSSYRTSHPQSCAARYSGSKIRKYIPDDLIEAMEFDQSYFLIPLSDNGEKLVDIRKMVDDNHLLAVFNDTLSATNQTRLYYLRKSVARALAKAIIDFNKQGLIPRFEYMYRRFEDQAAGFRRSVATMAQKYPMLDHATITQLAGVFVAAYPNTSAHLSGAAVDMTILDADKKPLDMGCPYIHPGPESKTDSMLVSKQARINRQVLKKTMTKHGFVNYPYEYWHYSLGDKIAARVLGLPTAKYGPIAYDPSSGLTQLILDGDQMFKID